MSERILEIAQVLALGHEIFEDEERFHLWLETPSAALGGEKPLDLLKTSFGKDLLLNELGRIDHGIFA